MALDPVVVNGVTYEWGSYLFKVDGQMLNGVMGVKYSDKMESTFQYGAGKARTPRGRTRGKYTADGGITLHKDTSAKLQAYLDNKSGRRGIGMAEFQFSIQLNESALGLVSVELKRCKVMGIEAGDDEGSEGLKEELPLSIFSITRNGRTLYDRTGAPGGGGIIGAIGNLLGF